MFDIDIHVLLCCLKSMSNAQGEEDLYRNYMYNVHVSYVRYIVCMVLGLQSLSMQCAKYDICLSLNDRLCDFYIYGNR